MHAGNLRGAHHALGVNLAHAGDIFRHRTGKEIHILRQIADKRAKRFRIPRSDVRAVQPNRAAGRRPDAHEQTAQCRFAGRARPDDGQGCTRFQGKGNILQNRALLEGKTHVFRRQFAFWRRQGHMFGGGIGKRRPDAPVSGSGFQGLLVGRHCLIQRGQGAAHDNGGGNHDPCCGGVGDGQIRANGVNDHLQADAGGLAHGMQQAHAPTGSGLQADDLGVHLMPARADGIDHTHRLHSGGVARGAAQEHGRAAVMSFASCNFGAAIF